ncbi:MAG: hypothetical protein ACRDY7_01500 [Acidimicrobiia bacterium]
MQESEPVTGGLPGSVTVPGAPPREGLSATGSATRTLLMMAGVALLLGALALAFSGPREQRTPAPAGVSGAPRPQISASSGLRLNPTSREAARRRAGIVTDPGDGPAA